jgi:hypothetical protein
MIDLTVIQDTLSRSERFEARRGFRINPQELRLGKIDTPESIIDHNDRSGDQIRGAPSFIHARKLRHPSFDDPTVAENVFCSENVPQTEGHSPKKQRDTDNFFHFDGTAQRHKGRFHSTPLATFVRLSTKAASGTQWKDGSMGS